MLYSNLTSVFHKEVWLHCDFQRKHMIPSLIEKYLFLGMSKNEVFELLGDAQNEWSHCIWRYYVETKTRKIFMKYQIKTPSHLYIYFNTNYEVIKIVKN